MSSDVQPIILVFCRTAYTHHASGKAQDQSLLRVVHGISAAPCPELLNGRLLCPFRGGAWAPEEIADLSGTCTAVDSPVCHCKVQSRFVHA